MCASFQLCFMFCLLLLRCLMLTPTSQKAPNTKLFSQGKIITVEDKYGNLNNKLLLFC